MDKINYYNVAIEEINKFKDKGLRPKLALHACCAPCSSHTLEFLTPFFEVTIVYQNSNIYPEAEFIKRRDEIERFVREFNINNKQDVKVIFLPYNHESFMAELRALAAEPEGGKRCHACYRKRIEAALKHGSENGFEYATTTLTISRQKNSQVINEIAKEIAPYYPTIKYFYSDFKKKAGLLRVREMKEEYNLYQQEYCGCEYSFRDTVLRNKMKKDNENH
ncbi:MAG: hypothetical protein BWX74_00675 [Tenericutes bacterium ADurb.Bin087]|nr:MAG: hypothetical protein BWX74_00675 [Tenericutes bacterium ADurb.Bin087]